MGHVKAMSGLLSRPVLSTLFEPLGGLQVGTTRTLPVLALLRE
jgi:hypothetical protein